MITSKDNERIKYIHKLKSKKYRDLENKFLIFGEHLIEEAKKSNLKLEVYTSNPNKGGTLISKELMKDINFTISPYDIFAIVDKVDFKSTSSLVLVLEDIQDPDNVGALLRSALAFDFTKVLISNKSADIYNDKTIRASKGALFNLEIIRCDVIEEASKYKELGYNIYITDVDGNDNSKLHEKSLLVLGNEGQGVTEEMRNLATDVLTIKTNNVESLNVNVAGSILMYEWSKL